MIAPLRALVWAGLVLGRVGAPLGAAAPTTVEGQPILEIEQKMPETLDPGVPFRVDIIVHNRGAGPAEDLVVTDAVPPGYEFLDGAPSPERGPASFAWRRPRLEAGESWSLQVHLRAKNGEADGPPRNAVDAVFQTHARGVCVGQLKRPELAVSATAPDGVLPGQPAVLRIAITNKGPGPVRRATLHAVLADGLTNPAGADLETPLDPLKAGETRVLSLEATATRAGDFRSRVSVDGEDVLAVEQTVLLHVDDSRLGVEARGPTALRKDLTGLFELTVRNEGASDARQVGLMVSVPDEILFVRASDNGAYDPLTHVIHWELGDLKAGGNCAVAWNGTARAAGDPRGLARVSVGQSPRREIVWTTRVIQGPASQPNAPTHGGKE